MKKVNKGAQGRIGIGVIVIMTTIEGDRTSDGDSVVAHTDQLTSQDAPTACNRRLSNVLT